MATPDGGRNGSIDFDISFLTHAIVNDDATTASNTNRANSLDKISNRTIPDRKHTVFLLQFSLVRVPG